MSAEPKYMLDTNICIYIQKRKSSSLLARFEKIQPGQAVVSAITWGELLYGAEKSQKRKQVVGLLNEFISLVPVCPMSPECGTWYGKTRAELEKRGLPIGPNDLWIAAHALALNVTLITSNTGEFSRIPRLKIENWT